LLTAPFSFLGVPVVTVPMRHAGPLPMGVQVIDQPNSEFETWLMRTVARQAEQAFCRDARPPHHQNLPGPHDGGAHREKWPLRIGSCVRHDYLGSNSRLERALVRFDRSQQRCEQSCAAHLMSP